MTDPARSPFRLDGSTALITGATKNIGFAIATAFAGAGSRVIMVARSQQGLDEAAERVRRSSGADVHTIRADVSTQAGADAVVEHAAATAPVDILVNNAHTTGSQPDRRMLEIDDVVWNEVLDTNLLGPFRLCRALGQGMMSLGRGSIINVMSGSGLLPTPNLGAYGVSKAALWMMTRYLAVECAPTIRVNAVCPGLISEDGQPRNDAHRAIIDSVPMKRVGRPEEIAGAALYLASPAASYTTGELLVVNGGRPW